MNKTSKINSIAIAVVLASGTVSGGAQAHSGVDYSIPVQLYVLGSLFHHGHRDHHYSITRHETRHSGGRHERHGGQRHKRHSHSRDGYRRDHSRPRHRH